MMRSLLGALAALTLIAAAGWTALAAGDKPKPAPAPNLEGSATAVFAGGCFWCVEADFDKVEGVLATTSGFAGGDVENPSYRQVTFGDTGHYEVVEVAYDPDIVSYRTLVDYFWRHVDPLDAGGQFCDRGASYRTAVFVAGEAQRADADASKTAAETALGESVVTTILDLDAFYPAEEYHQDYYKKKPVQYRYYRLRCGRDARVAEVWGK
ncbi:MAG: peptide-methionine (S)-S-oxide reductase MsrA [Pseudomonadota bacterium]